MGVLLKTGPGLIPRDYFHSRTLTVRDHITRSHFFFFSENECGLIELGIQGGIHLTPLCNFFFTFIFCFPCRKNEFDRKHHLVFGLVLFIYVGRNNLLKPTSEVCASEWSFCNMMCFLITCNWGIRKPLFISNNYLTSQTLILAMSSNTYNLTHRSNKLACSFLRLLSSWGWFIMEENWFQNKACTVRYW